MNKYPAQQPRQPDKRLNFNVLEGGETINAGGA